MGITKPCGCHTDEAMPFLTYCPLHEAASRLLFELKNAIRVAERDHPSPPRWTRRARALVEKIERRKETT